MDIKDGLKQLMEENNWSLMTVADAINRSQRRDMGDHSAVPFYMLDGVETKIMQCFRTQDVHSVQILADGLWYKLSDVLGSCSPHLLDSHNILRVSPGFEMPDFVHEPVEEEDGQLRAAVKMQEKKETLLYGAMAMGMADEEMINAVFGSSNPTAYASRIAMDKPCPCGSGRNHELCCGRSRA